LRRFSIPPEIAGSAFFACTSSQPVFLLRQDRQPNLAATLLRVLEPRRIELRGGKKEVIKPRRYQTAPFGRNTPRPCAEFQDYHWLLIPPAHPCAAQNGAVMAEK
jgi:hypothetical protein